MQINEAGITDAADYLQLVKYIRLKKYLICEQVDVTVKMWNRVICYIL